MHKLEPILYVLVFLTLVMLVEGIYLLISGGRRQINRQAGERLRRYASRLPSGRLSDEGRSIMVERRGSDGFLSRIPGLVRLELFLYRAGMPLSVRSFTTLSLLLAGTGFFVGLTVLRDPLRGLMLSAVGLLPAAWVELRRRRRMALFDKQLPDAMDLLCRSLRSGHSMRAGFHMVGQEMADPIGTEFAQIAEEVTFGMDLRDALRNFAHRINHSDMPFFINAVVIQRETGGNLASILENISRMVRVRLRFFARVKSQLAQIKLSANVLAVIPVIMVVAVSGVNPGYMAPLFETPAGHTMTSLAAGLVVVGWIICRRLGAVKY